MERESNDLGLSRKHILSAVEASLRRLNTDYIDLYQLHGGTIEDRIDETIEAFEQLQQQGKIRYYGISSIRPNVIREYVTRSKIVSVMMQYSLADRRPEEAMLQLLLEKNIAVISRGALAQGMLVDKTPKDYLGHSAQDLQNAAILTGKLSQSKSSAAAIATRFVLQHPAVTSAVVGCSSIRQLDEIAAVDAQITDAEFSQLQQILPPKRYEQHR